MKNLAASLAFAGVIVSSVVEAGPPAPLDDPFLDNLVGKWKIERRIHGTLVANSLDADWVLQHQFLRLRMVDLANPPKYEAIVLIGWDRLNERYVAHWTDTYGGGASAMGYGRREGNSLEFRFEYPDGPFFNTFNWEPSAKGWTMNLENTGKDGKRVPFAQDRVRR